MNRPEAYLLLGVMRDPPDSRRTWDGHVLALRKHDYRLAVYEGIGPREEVVIEPVSYWLEMRPFARWLYSEKKASGMEPPGWFERELRNMGCDWFVPMVHRIAAGEQVPLEEITAAYAAHNHGRSMPCGTIDELFTYAKQRGMLK